MVTTRGRKAHELPPSVRLALSEHGFGTPEAGTISEHLLAPAVRLHVVMSARTRSLVVWQFVHVPGHLADVLKRGSVSGGAEAFARAMMVADTIITNRYCLGPPVADTVEEA
jgi:hypothetical protein